MEGNKKKSEFWSNGVVLLVYVKSTHFSIYLRSLRYIKARYCSTKWDKIPNFWQYFIVFDLNLASVRPISSNFCIICQNSLWLGPFYIIRHFMHTSKIIENSQKKWYHFTQFGIFLHYLTSFDVIWHYATLFDMPIISQRSKNVVKRCWVTWRVPLVVYEKSGQ